MIKNENFNSLSTLHNQLKVSTYTSNKRVSHETSNTKCEKIKDTIQISTDINVNNEARINEIKEKIQNNQYKIDTNLIAKSMINDLSLLK